MSNLYLDFAVNGMYLARKNRPPLVDGSFKFIFARFEFSKEWENADAFLLASRDNETYTMLVENNEAEIPYEAISTTGTFEIQLVGNRGETRMATNPVAITIASSEMANNPSGEETRLTSDFLITSLANVKAEADNAKISELNADAYANRAKTEADKAEQARGDAEVSATNAYNASQQANLLADRASLSASESKAQADRAKAISDAMPEQVDTYVESNMDRLKGKDGYTPIKNIDYFDGQNGRDGRDGKDGVIPAEQLAQITKNAEDISQQSDEITTLTDKVNSLPSDVQVNGASVVGDGVANIPIASNNNLGVVRTLNSYGVTIYDNGRLGISQLSVTELNARSSLAPITIRSFDFAVKKALCDVGTTEGNVLQKPLIWSEREKQNARERLGVAIVTLTQAEYDALEVKSPDTTYLVLESD